MRKNPEMVVPRLSYGQQDGDLISVKKTFSFRPPDEEFCSAFNIGLRATGMSKAEFAVECIRAGMVLAAKAIIARRKAGEAAFARMERREMEAGR